MTRTLIASLCGLVLLASGCGSDNSAQEKTTAERKTACSRAAAAMTAYHHAGQAVGADFLEKPALVKRVIAAAGVFRARLRTLSPLTNSAQREQLEELQATLVQHEKLLGAIVAHDLALAHKYATPGFEPALDSGQANFRTICKVPPE
jgi:hypothetical protein